MHIDLSFPGGKRVSALLGDVRVDTDQPTSLGGEGAHPAPFDLFLASVATCAGIYALGFCQARGLSTEGLALSVDTVEDTQTHLPTQFVLRVTPPVGFPEKYHSALLRSVENCKVKKTIALQPRFDVRLEGVVAAEAANA